jgi:arylsulfatase A-like enzyme
MTRTAKVEPQLLLRRPSQQMRRVVTPGAADLPLRPRSLVSLAVVLGLATGVLELLAHFLRRRFINPSSFGSLQLNPHAFWMVPLSDALIFGACGIGLAVVAFFVRRRWACVVGVFGLVFLAAFVVLLTFRGLTLVGCAALAGGVAARLTWRIASRPQHLGRIIRFGLPALAALVAGLSGINFGREKLAEHQLPAATPGAPNVLFIVLDTVRAESLSLHGYSRETSPQLEQLARRGVRFDNARTAAAWTLPSHASMFTGRWAHELSTRPDWPLDQTYPTLAEFLRDRGYATAGFVGNTYFCNAWFGLNRGFLHYEDVAVSLLEMIRSSSMGRYLVQELAPATSIRDRIHAYFNRKDARTINRDCLAWLSSRPQGRPFFVFLNYFDAHDPYIAAKDAPRHFGLRPETAQEIAALRDWLHNDKTKLSPRVLQVARDGYDDGIAYVDDQLGRLFAALEQQGLLDNTVVVVTADHGELLGEHNSFGHGSHLYRQVVNVPLLIAGPRSIPAGQSISEPVSLRDLPATVTDLCGLASASPFPGHTLSRFWARTKSDAAPEDEFLLTETADELSRGSVDSTRARALAFGGKVYIRNKDRHEELYDVVLDPAELHDLSQNSLSQPALEEFRDKMKQIDIESRAAQIDKIRK